MAAYLLKKQGHDVTCAFMRNWDSLTNDDIQGNPTLNEEVCPQEQDYNDAKKTADRLGLKLLRVDFIEEYWQNVFHTFLDEYRKGRTPNPDILCNKYIKFSSFMKFAEKNGFDTVATGHYAKIFYKDGMYLIGKANDRNKDQSYFLCQIDRSCLSHILFPLSDISKPEVRKIAEELNLDIAHKKDSTGICFIGERHFREFLSNYLPMKPGKILNLSNKNVAGTHQGVLYYTIGQRKGLDIGGTGPYFVVGKNIKTNELYVVDSRHEQLLYSDSCIIRNMNILADFQQPIDCNAKFRYRQSDNPVHLSKLDDNRWLAEYPQKVRSVTPGQEAVFYDGDIMLGGGVIDRVFLNSADMQTIIEGEAAEIER